MFHKIKFQGNNISPAKARLIARLKSDGSIFVAGTTNYWLKFDSKNQEELDTFSKDIEEVYGLTTHEALKRSGKNPNKMLKHVYVRSKLAFEDMQKYGPFYSEDWRIPAQIKESTIGIKKEFLKIFAEDEGSVILNGKEIRIYSINRTGLEDLRELFLEFSITTKIRGNFGERRNVFALIINKKDNILKFRNLVGFRSSEKREKLDKLIQLLN